LHVRQPLREGPDECISQFFGEPSHSGKADKKCVFTNDLPILQHPSIATQPNSYTRIAIVRTAPLSNDYRDYVRKTWKPLVEKTGIPVLFVIGTSSSSSNDHEAKMYGDILQADFVDSYGNLSLKMVVAYRYLIRHTDVEQIIVFNDDTIVNATVII